MGPPLDPPDRLRSGVVAVVKEPAIDREKVGVASAACRRRRSQRSRSPTLLKYAAGDGREAACRARRRLPLRPGSPSTAVPRPPSLPTQVCPLLLRVFPRLGAHHQLEDFARRGDEPKDEVQIYTWMDATLR